MSEQPENGTPEQDGAPEEAPQEITGTGSVELPAAFTTQEEE